MVERLRLGRLTRPTPSGKLGSLVVDGRFVDPGTIAATDQGAGHLIARILATPSERRTFVANVVARYGIDRST